MKKFIQIDVKKQTESERTSGIMRMMLNTSERDVPIYMGESDYQALVGDGFFVRDGKEADSSNAVNTTAVYLLSDR